MTAHLSEMDIPSSRIKAAIAEILLKEGYIKAYTIDGDEVKKSSNHSGGTLGGMSDGGQLVFRAAVKPTPSIAQAQQTVDDQGNDTLIVIHGRHDPIIVPRAVVVVESMAAITILDLMMQNASSQVDALKNFYKK